MTDRERELVALRRIEVSVVFVALARFLRKLVVGAALDRALLIEQVEAALVVDEFDGLPLYALARILGLLRLEDVPIELLLQPLVGIIDAQLFKRVDGEVLKAKYVEDADERGGGVLVDQLCIAPLDQPGKELPIERLGKRVTRILGLIAIQPHRHLVITRHEAARAQRMAELRVVDGHQLGDVLDRRERARRDHRMIIPTLLKIDLREEQHCSERAQHALLVGWRERNRLHRIHGAHEVGGVVHARDLSAPAPPDEP
eukprot:scaffold53196_cov28-Tisochrysis_lutea.AAC.3